MKSVIKLYRMQYTKIVAASYIIYSFQLTHLRVSARETTQRNHFVVTPFKALNFHHGVILMRIELPDLNF